MSDPSQTIDDLGYLELTAQDPTVTDNNGPEQMEKVIAQSPTDLTEIKDVVVDLSLAQDKTAQGLNIVAEAVKLRTKGKVSASEAMALEDVVNGIVDVTNPIGLYTDVATGANLDETVKRVNQRGMDLVDEGRQATRALSERLVKLLNAAGSGTLETIDTYHQQYVRAVAAYTDVHGFLPLDFQRRGDDYLCNSELAMMGDLLSKHLDEVNRDRNDAIGKYVRLLQNEGLLSIGNSAVRDIITGEQSFNVDGKTYWLNDIAGGQTLQSLTYEDERSKAPDMFKLSSVVSGAGSKTSVDYIRSVAGAMLGLATYLNNSLKKESDDANAAREDSYDAVAIASLGQALQRRFTQGIALLHATAALYNELALTENKQASTVHAATDSPSLENLRQALGIMRK